MRIAARSVIVVLCTLALGALAARLSCSTETETIALGSPHAGIRRFVAGDFGGISLETLETNALPYKVMASALLLEERRRSGTPLDLARLPALLQRYGFLQPERIANWPAGLPPPRPDRPLGMVSREIASLLPPLRVDAVNLGCAACHAGVLYDAAGQPTREVWLGLPNTSIDLERYTQDVYAGLVHALADRDTLVETAEQLFPEMGWQERTTLRRLLLPRIRERMETLAGSSGGPSPFSNGGPGRTNGVAALKLVLGLMPRGEPRPETGFTSIPELGARGLRSSLLYDGFYAPDPATRFQERGTTECDARHISELAAIVTFFTVPTMGMHPSTAERAIPEVDEIMTWLVREYRSPPFPGPIDSVRAEAGGAVYAARCASCHGTMSAATRDVHLVRFPNRLSPDAEMHTSPARWQAIDTGLLEALAHNAIGRHAAPSATGGYVAPILSGLWATAPYLHNGSVPTLWHLMHPRERPARFQVGGHALDWEKVGIRGELDAHGDWVYPDGLRPWSQPELYDCARAGQENSGHAAEFEALDEDEKGALLEYLKLL
jgi:hypothetical protein